MRELTFRITDIEIEKHINGNSKITAVCLETNNTVCITVSSLLRDDKRIVKEKLQAKHDEMNPSKIEDTLSIGDIL